MCLASICALKEFGDERNPCRYRMCVVVFMSGWLVIDALLMRNGFAIGRKLDAC